MSRKALAAAIGSGDPAAVQRAAAGIGVDLTGEGAAQLTAAVRASGKPGYLFLT